MAEITCGRCGGRYATGEGVLQGVCPKCLLEAGTDKTLKVGHDGKRESTGGSRPRMEPPRLEKLKKLFPQLEIQNMIGQGGMGMVYKAVQPALDRTVALKMIWPEFAEDPEFAERFLREAKTLAKLSHPNIIAIHDFGKTDDFCYLVMEYVDGMNLRQAIKSSALSPGEALTVVARICDALQYAHDKGIVHRDIKPENILLDKNKNVKIVDFGLAKIAEHESQLLSLTQDGQLMGTPNYMAPEQRESFKEVDQRADIYSLGVVFYEMLTGYLPLGRFPAPSKTVQVDVRIDDVVFRTLEREPERRYQKASEVKNDVEAIANDPQGAAGKPSAARHDTSQGNDYWGMNERTYSTLLHLSQFASYAFPLAGVILPIVMWVTHKDKNAFIKKNGAMAVNWTCSVHVYLIAACILLLASLGTLLIVVIPLLIALVVMNVVFCIFGAVKANNGEVWKYPMSIPFIKADATESSPKAGLLIGGCALAIALAVAVGLALFLLIGVRTARMSTSSMPDGVRQQVATKVFQTLGVAPQAVLTTLTPADKQVVADTVARYEWPELANAGQLRGGEAVTLPDGRSALKISNATGTPSTVRICAVQSPPVTKTKYALRGEVKYENVKGNGYLEMWSYFPPTASDAPEGAYFSRTLGESGEMGKITGTSNWRKFTLPFDRTGTGAPPCRLEFNLFLPAQGTVYVSHLELVE